LGRDDRRDRRLVALALLTHAGKNRRRAGGIDAHATRGVAAGRMDAARARGFHHERDADTAVNAFFPELRLFFAQLVVAGDLRRALETQMILPAVVKRAGDVAIRERLGWDEVLHPDLDRIEIQTPSSDVHQALDDVRGVGLADAAERAVRRLVGGYAGRVDRVILNLIDAGHVERARHDRVVDGVSRAHVSDDLIPQPEDRAVFLECHLDVVDLVAAVAAVAHVLDAGLAPFN